MENRYYKGNPINNKAIAKDTEPIFCPTYKDRIRFACANNNVETNHIQMVRVANKLSVIILN